MSRGKSYNTKQKDLIFNLIKNEKNKFTVKDIYDKLNRKIGLTTIYRFVDKLVNDSILTKSVDARNIVYYQYIEKCNCDNHFYLKCDKCGILKHIHCECINEITLHILKEHNFKSSENGIIINGICEMCAKKGCML